MPCRPREDECLFGRIVTLPGLEAYGRITPGETHTVLRAHKDTQFRFNGSDVQMRLGENVNSRCRHQSLPAYSDASHRPSLPIPR